MNPRFVTACIAVLAVMETSCGTITQAESRPVDGTEPTAHREVDSLLDLGMVLHSHEDDWWGLHLLLPASVGLTDFDLGESPNLDNLATVAVVPTAEFIVPLDQRWTLQPFVGLGAAWQSGAEQLVGSNDFIGLLNGGLRVTRWQKFAARYWFGLKAQVGYDAALTARDGLLGDWGSVDGAVELRRDFGRSRPGPRFQGGLYVKGQHFWDPVELDITGITPPTVDNLVEVGISLGATEPIQVLGISIPHVFVGVVAGEGFDAVRIQFGRL